jgi:hypothetical protein
MRVAVGRVGDRLLAAPLSRGAGVITSLVQADGLALIPRGTQGMEAGEQVEVRCIAAKQKSRRTIFCIGSHDLTLDLMSQFLAQHDRRLASANVGSQGGLIAFGAARRIWLARICSTRKRANTTFRTSASTCRISLSKWLRWSGGSRA